MITTDEKQLKLVEKLTAVAGEMYEEYQQRIYPKWPWVLIKVMPKEQKVGSIILPTKQNKVLYEGIVLETWKPFERTTMHVTEFIPTSELIKELAGQGCHLKLVEDEPTQVQRMEKVLVKSELAPGDHVLFPHYEGLPVPFLDEGEFRIVREINKFDPEGRCEVLGKFEYEREKVSKTLRKILNDYSREQALAEIQKEFYLIRQNGHYLSMSGM